MTDPQKREFPFPKNLNNAEERIFAKHAQRIYTEVIYDLQAARNESDEEAQARAVIRVLADPFIGPALLLISAKREIPETSIADVIEHMDAGDWSLTFGNSEESPVEPDEAPAPLAPPPPSSE